MSSDVNQRMATPFRAELVARWLVVLLFLGLAARFWHPYYGLTRLLQFDESAAAVMLPELRQAPLFLYPGENGYDGLYYAELAADPLARSEHLPAALDNAAYRARRILPSWLAWAVAGGDPVGALRAYAWINLVAWLALAAALARLLPPGDWRRTLGWAGVLLSAGALHSVRLSLCDLPALLLLVLAVTAMEGGRVRTSGAWFGLAALTRETSLVALAALAAEPRRYQRNVLAALVLAVAPVALWLAYLRLRFGPADPGLGNFQWPLAGLARKWVEDGHALGTEPNTLLAATTLLSTLGLTVQAGYVALRRQRLEAWWWVAAVHVALLAVLGQPVWEGHPGAATRVLLPLTLAFNVVAARNRAAWGWIVAGNLGVFAGLLTWLHVPPPAHELAAGRVAGAGYVATLGPGWHGVEQDRRHRWAWAPRQGAIELRLAPGARENGPQAVVVRLDLRAVAPRGVEIRQGGRVLWRGEVGLELGPVEVRGIEFAAGAARLEFASDSPPGRVAGDGRDLGFAVYDLRLE